MTGFEQNSRRQSDRRAFIGGSDARIIMGDNEPALLRLWREKRGEVEPEDLSDNLVVQLGAATEELNRRWFERKYRSDCHRRPALGPAPGPAMDDGNPRRHGRGHWRSVRGEIHAAVGILGRGGRRKAHGPATAQYVGNEREAVRALDHNGRRKMVEISISADPLYQHLLLTAEKKFWRCVESGEPPRLFGVEPPRPRIAAVRMVDMSASNSWAEFATIFRATREAFVEHERAKTELKALMPEDAKEAFGHGVRAKRSKSGAISFELLDLEAGHAPVQ